MFGKKKSSSNSSAKSKGKGKKSGSYYDATKRKRRKYLLIIVPMIAVVVGVLVVTATMYSAELNRYGSVGSAHEHAGFMINVNGTPIDFSQEIYQVQSRLIHVEGGDGFTLHRHTDRVPFGEFLASVGMGIEDGCFSVSGGGQTQEFCSNGEENLRAFVNRTELTPPSSITEYIVQDGDRILVTYGSQSAEELSQELDAVDEGNIIELT